MLMPVPYHSFLLRIFCIEVTPPSKWRASLEEPHDGKVIYFANMQLLFDYLNQLSDPNDAQPTSPTIKPTNQTTPRQGAEE